MKTHKIRLHFILIILFSVTRGYTQSGSGCGQAEVMQLWLKNHPELIPAFEQAQQQLCSTAPTLQQSKTTAAAPLYTIPVVFHILHLGGAENISDAQVIDQISILNRDYQKKNADTISVTPSYTNNIANVQFAFQLASIDPNGNCTNGIIRHYDPNTNWDANNLGLFAYTWPRDKYLNIYVVKTMNIQATAYTFLPGLAIPPSADAIVTLHNMVGSIGTGNPGTTSRVLTHEVGHWFNLAHIWGVSNQPGITCGDDGVTDTPITKGFSVCTNPAGAIVCNPGIVENMQNYMDYSPCKLMFTNGQSQRMHTCITGTVNSRNNLITPANLLATGITTTAANCLPQVQLSIPATRTVCVGNSLSIQSFSANATVTSYSWSATNGATIANPSAVNTSVTFNNPGQSVVSCVAANGNGSATAVCTVIAVNSVAQYTGSTTESFESAALPANWTVLNPNTLMASWNIATNAGSQGAQSMYVNGESTPNNSIEILETPGMDFLNNPGATFTYKYAYAKQSNSHSDIFKVQASKDCGGSWQDIFVPNMSSYASGSGGVSSTLFVPTTAQWKLQNLTANLNFYNLLSEPHVTLRFYFQEDATTGYGNRFYLDDINFTTPNGITNLSQDLGYSVFPNPSSRDLTLAFQLSTPTRVHWELQNSCGQSIAQSPEISYNEGTHRIHLENIESLSPGIYLLNTFFNGTKIVRKVIIE